MQPPIDLSNLDLGLDRKQQANFAQTWFAGRNPEEAIGADQERLFKSHLAMAYPACGMSTHLFSVQVARNMEY